MIKGGKKKRKKKTPTWQNILQCKFSTSSCITLFHLQKVIHFVIPGWHACVRIMHLMNCMTYAIHDFYSHQTLYLHNLAMIKILLGKQLPHTISAERTGSGTSDLASYFFFRFKTLIQVSVSSTFSFSSSMYSLSGYSSMTYF